MAAQVLGMSGSPIARSNTDRAVEHILEATGLETEFVKLSRYELQPCRACLGCKESNDCVVRDDGRALAEKFAAASAFVLLTVIDGPLEQGVLSASQATATVLGQFSIAASLIFVALLVYWRDTELSRSAVQGLLVAVVLLGIGHFQLIVGLEFPTPGTPQVSDIAALLGWLVLVSSGLIATLRPGPTPRSQARTAKARRFRQLVIPAAALFLTWWAVTTTGRPVSRLSTVVIVTMGLLLAIRIGVAILAMERESEERHRAEQLASRLRLRSVMGQMSPHFLFNALHSLSALVRRDPRSAEDVVERLGLLLRYGIDTGDDMVRLKDEWGFATGYLELEKVRLRSRLNTTAHLASEAADTLVPPFIIQPLVENAIHHAVNPFAIGGEIEMVAELQGDRLRIEVRDTGPGADDETLSTASGVGLRGVRAQLSTHYAEGEWSLHGGRTGDGRFFMRMELPAG